MTPKLLPLPNTSKLFEDDNNIVLGYTAEQMHDYALAALAQQEQEPVSPDMHRWCAYVGGMVAHWVMSEPNAHVRLGDDQFEAAIAGIIERRLWALPKRDTTPQPQPAPLAGEVTDERLLSEWDRVSHIAEAGNRRLAFARAVFALRPQAVPMTPEVRQQWRFIRDRLNTPGMYQDRVGKFVEWFEAHHGITAKAEGGV